MSTTRKNCSQIGCEAPPQTKFNLLQSEMAWLNPSGEGDIDWRRVELKASLSLTSNNNDLLSHIRYTLARTHIAGLMGLCEGLEKIAGLLEQQWETICPLSVPARMTMLTWLSVQLQSLLLTIRLTSHDLPLLYQTEGWLVKMEEAIGARVLKHLIQLSRLKVQVSQATDCLKEQTQSAEAAPEEKNREGKCDVRAYLHPDEHDIQDAAATLWHQSRTFVSGMLVMGIIGGAGLLGNHLRFPEQSHTQHIEDITENLLPDSHNTVAYLQPEVTTQIGDFLGELEKSPSSYALRVRVEYK